MSVPMNAQDLHPRRDSAAWLIAAHPRPDAAIRLICFPHGGGGPQVYHDWGQALPDWIEVLAVNPPGRGSRYREPSIESIAEMTAALATALIPSLDRPFAFFGHSVGALVAFTLTRTLRQHGAPLPLRLFLSSYAAPELAEQAAPMHLLDDAALMRSITSLGLVGSDVAANSELIDLIIPPIRADFVMAETHRLESGQPLPLPITAMGGYSDDIVAPDDLIGWAKQTEAGFTHRLFAGGHFYTQSARAELLSEIECQLKAEFDALPKSVLVGEAVDYPTESCLHEHFRAQVAKTPDKTAIVGVDRRLTFAELDRESDLLGRQLMDLGTSVDCLVAILMPPSVDFVIAYIAALKAGGAYMPVETETPEQLVAAILEGVQPSAVVTNAYLRDRLPEEWRDARCITLDEDWQLRLSARELPVFEDQATRPGPDSLAYCVMSSGTTGAPKGIICPHQGAVNSYWWRYQHLPYGEQEREAANIFFVWEVLRPMLQGWPAYVIPDEVISDPRPLIAYLALHRITRVLLTPSLLEQVLNAEGMDLVRRLPDLRIIILNGEVVTMALRDRVANLLPNVRLINDYSISECHDVCTTDLAEIDRTYSRRYAPAGRPMSNVSVYVLDNALKPVPQGAVGEIYVAGPTLARGYLDQPEMTAERFLPDPIAPDGGRMFRTGDVGRMLPDGQFEITGRSQFMIKLRGYSVVPSAVEAAILSHLEIGAAAVLPVDDVRTGQPESLVAYVVGRGREPEPELLGSLRAYLKTRLPHYAIPSHFIPMAKLPLSESSGKLDRRRLPDVRQALAKQRVERSTATSPDADLMPRVHKLWARVLGTAPETGDDNFFDLGGHSLLAIQLVLAAEEEFGVRIDVVEMFDNPTVAAFCTHIEYKLTRAQASGPVARPHRRDPRKPDGGQGTADIAVIAMTGRFPGAEDLDQLWANLMEGVSSVRGFTDEELAARGVPAALLKDQSYVKVGAVIDGVEYFDPRFWGLSDTESTLMDPQHRLFIECCWQVLEQAGYPPRHTNQNGARTGVFAGCYLPSYLLNHLGGAALLDPADPITFHMEEIGNDKDYLPTRTSYLLNLTGPSVSVQTSCSTGLVAIASAAQALRAGQCDMALAGAASITFPQAGYRYVDGHINARGGQCRTFDAEASGTILGDGVGAVLLKRLKDAEADGDRVLAVIKGFAVNNDGASKAGYSAPSARGQAEVVGEALDMARVDARTITYVEAHGTGTLIGDPIEVRALTQAYRHHTDDRGFCAIGSIKPNIGHSNIAAGVAGFIKTVLSLHHGQLAPSINFDTPNAELRLEETPFFVNTEARAWTTADGLSRRAGVSSFGIGGTNCHMILEQAPEVAREKAVVEGREAAETEQRPQILPISAKSAASLEAMRGQLVAHLRANPQTPLANVAHTLQFGREHFPIRLAVAAQDDKEAIAALERLKPPPADGVRSRSVHRKLPTDGGIVFLFPGQGAQHARMGAGLYRDSASFRTHFDRCADLFRDLVDRDLRQLFTADGTEPLLASAQGLQPALFSIEYALAATLMDWGLRPAGVAGHSLGEYVAAVVAGVLSLEDAARLVAVRGRAMEAAEAGGMLALTATVDEVQALISAQTQVSLAAINSPNDAVLAGPVGIIDRLEKETGGRGIAARRLHVSRAFHSPMMSEAADTLQETARELHFSAPKIAMASNLTGGMLDPNKPIHADYWQRQMLGTVRFGDNLASLLKRKPQMLLEVGPGRTLSGLIGKVAGAQRAASGANAPGSPPPRVISCMRHPRDGKSGDWQTLHQALATAWAAGAEFDFSNLHEGRSGRRVALPTYAFEKRRCWPRHDAAQRVVETVPGRCTDSVLLAPEERYYLPSWGRAPAPEGPAEAGSCQWLVLRDDAGRGHALVQSIVAQLEGRGESMQEVFRDSDRAGPALGIDSTDSNGFERLLGAIEAAEPNRSLRVLYLWSLDDAADASTEAFLNLAIALSRAASARPLHLWAISNGALKVSEETARPTHASLIGPLLVLAQENPHVASRLIDIRIGPDTTPAAIDTLAYRIVEESAAARPRSEPLLAIRGLHLWVERFEQMTLGGSACANGRTRLLGRQPDGEGAHIITGGLGRIGLVLARHLSGLGCNVVLTTRSQFPARAQWAEIASGAIESHDATRAQTQALLEMTRDGADVSVLRADMAERADVARMLDVTRRQYGRIGGIFHAAGLADLKYLHEMSTAVLRAEFASKQTGLGNLRVELLAGATDGISKEQAATGPDFVLLFSSLASVLGGLGMAAYAAANRYMDLVAEEAPEAGGISWIAVNWDDWDFTYTKEQIVAYDKTRAGLAMAPPEGLAALEAILGTKGLHRVLVSTTPMAPRVAKWLERVPGTAPPPEAAADSEPNSAAMATGTQDEAAGLTEDQQLVRAAYVSVLGTPDLGLDDDFFSLGGDSLMATQIVLVLSNKLQPGTRLRVADAFEHPTVRQLAAHIAVTEGRPAS